MTPVKFEDLNAVQRRRLVLRSAIRIALTVLVVVGLYVVLPAGRSGTRAIVELAVGLVAFLVLVAWLVREIMHAEYPGLRAAEALATGALVLIFVFAFTYLSISRADDGNFSESLDHVSAVYFAVTTLSTVGFGDITAKTDLARLMVTIQMLLDLVVIAAFVRVIVFAARVGVRRQRGEEAPSIGQDLP